MLRCGDTIAVYRHAAPHDDHPFRSAHHGDVLAIAEPRATAGLTNTMLMLWRPATAYMAIALAVMIPVVLALMTT